VGVPIGADRDPHLSRYCSWSSRLARAHAGSRSEADPQHGKLRQPREAEALARGGSLIMGVRRQCPALQASALGRLWADPSLHSNDRNGANRKPSLARPARLRLRGPNGARDEFHLAATAQNLRNRSFAVAWAPSRQGRYSSCARGHRWSRRARRCHRCAGICRGPGCAARCRAHRRSYRLDDAVAHRLAATADPRRCDYFKPDFFNGIGQNRKPTKAAVLSECARPEDPALDPWGRSRYGPRDRQHRGVQDLALPAQKGGDAVRPPQTHPEARWTSQFSISAEP